MSVRCNALQSVVNVSQRFTNANSLGKEINYNHDGSKLYYASINSSSAHPPPPSGKREAFTLVVTPGGWWGISKFYRGPGAGY